MLRVLYDDVERPPAVGTGPQQLDHVGVVHLLQQGVLRQKVLQTIYIYTMHQFCVLHWEEGIKNLFYSLGCRSEFVVIQPRNNSTDFAFNNHIIIPDKQVSCFHGNWLVKKQNPVGAPNGFWKIKYIVSSDICI